MRIEIVSDNRREFKLSLPTRLACNGLTAFLISRQIKKHVGKKIFSARQLRRFFRAVHRERKRLGRSWELIHVTTKKGTQVQIFP